VVDEAERIGYVDIGVTHFACKKGASNAPKTSNLLYFAHIVENE
jgi:hypothetical protein